MKRAIPFCGIVVLLLCQFAHAEGVAQTAPTSQPVMVSLEDKKALDANMGKEVIVEGTVATAAWSASGRVFLIKFNEGIATNFQGALFAKLREDMEKAFHGDLSDAFEGGKIQITGKLQMYREHPEILINDPKQITILIKGPGHSPHAGPATRPAA